MSDTLTKDQLLNDIAQKWDELHTFIASLTEEELMQPTDAGGWAIKDHLVNLAVWEQAAIAMLEGKDKREFLNISPDIWSQGEDVINAVLQQRYENLSGVEAKQLLEDTHQHLLDKLNEMTEAQLNLPYHHYHPTSSDERPIAQFIIWDVVWHYDEHLPWMKAIVD